MVFSGGFAWVGLYGEDIDKAYAHELFNVAELDEPDEITMSNFHREFDLNDWRMMIAHVIGVDHAGHYYLNAGHKEIERKLVDAEKIL